MFWRIEIKLKDDVFDAFGAGIHKAIQDLGIQTVTDVRVIQVYNLEGHLNEGQIQTACRELLVDPITQDYRYAAFDSTGAAVRTSSAPFVDEKGAVSIETAYNPGVMDPVERSTIKGLKDLGIEAVDSVRTARKYIVRGTPASGERELVTNKVLLNKLIQHVVQTPYLAKTAVSPAGFRSFNLIHVELIKAGDRQLKTISRQGQLFLNLNEMKAIQRYYKKLKRNPTDCELETIAQTWSEHCYHKTFRGNIRYQYSENGKKKTRIIRSLLKSTIVRATNEIGKSWCVSVFHDNAGVIRFDKDSHVCFKVETHNHPSALEPYGGANTGLGGVIRDILGTGLGAKPLCSTDVFCFAPPDTPFEALPAGTLHPKRIMKGVISGVRDYGNKMGIPTVNGAIVFDKEFVGNPLVYCGNVGILPKDRVQKKVRLGDLIVVAGGKTGRDGIHGATFSSGELTDASEVISSGAVQIGDPIEEKKVLDVLMQARDRHLYTSITDCGAGGLSSAVGEMAKDLGARVDLEKVSLKYEGLNYTEIWISESQERMVVAVPPKNIQKFLDVFRAEDVEAVVIGEFTGTRRLELFYHGRQVCDLAMDFLHEGIPNVTKEAVWTPPKIRQARIPAAQDWTAKLLEVLGHYNVCSKEWVIRQYDHEVQGGSVIKPLCGVYADGPSDASVVRPKLDSPKGIAVSNGINPRFGKIDPFWMAASCIDEAVRQIIAVGGDLEKIAILDNFCWGNPDKPDRLGSLVRAAEGCYKTAVGYGTPFISGKDSLYNEYTEGRKSMAIPGTLLISAIGIVEDVTRCVTMDFKKAGNAVYIVGETLDELGGSIFWATFDRLGANVPRVDTVKGTKLFKALARAVRLGLVRSMHDCSEGGLAVALAEMAFSGGLGVSARLERVPFHGGGRRNDTVLFSETNSRLIVEVAPADQGRFEQILKGISCGWLGEVRESQELIVWGLDGEICLNSSLKDLKDAWQKTLRW